MKKAVKKSQTAFFIEIYTFPTNSIRDIITLYRDLRLQGPVDAQIATIDMHGVN